MPPMGCLKCTQKSSFICLKCGFCPACCVVTCEDQPGRLVSTESREGTEKYRATMRERLKDK